MTAVAVIATKRFSVVVADTLFTDASGSRFFGTKLKRMKSGLVLGGAGETGPLWRRIWADPKWQDLADIDDLYERIANHPAIDEKQFDGDNQTDCEILLVVEPGGRVAVTGPTGDAVRSMPVTHGGSVLPATMEAIGCGRGPTLTYVLGRLRTMSLKDAKVELQSQSRVEALLREAIAATSSIDAFVGGPLESMVVK